MAEEPGLKSTIPGEHSSFPIANDEPAFGVPTIIKFATSLLVGLLDKYILASNPPLLKPTIFTLSCPVRLMIP